MRTSTFPSLQWVPAARIALESKSSLGNGLLPTPWCPEVKDLCKLHESLLIFNLISCTSRRSDFFSSWNWHYCFQQERITEMHIFEEILEMVIMSLRERWMFGLDEGS